MLEWVDWFNNRRLLEPLGYVSPAEFEKRYHLSEKPGAAQEAARGAQSTEDRRESHPARSRAKNQRVRTVRAIVVATGVRHTRRRCGFGKIGCRLEFDIYATGDEKT